MTQTEERIVKNVLEKIHADKSEGRVKFSIQALNHENQQRTVIDFLHIIVDSAGCHSYLFIYLCTRLIERYGKEILDCLWNVLDNYVIGSAKEGNARVISPLNNRDEAFAAYYCIALVLYRNLETDKLKDFLLDYYKHFIDDYPMTYELFSRYCDINNDSLHEMRLAKVAIKKLDKIADNLEKKNDKKFAEIQIRDDVALKITHVCALNAIMEYCFLRNDIEKPNERESILNGISDEDSVTDDELLKIISSVETAKYTSNMIDDSDIDYAEACINEAIVYNPKYPKYHFLRAQLLFYKNVFSGKAISPKAVKEINDELENAKKVDDVNSKDYGLRLSRYDRFKRIVDSFVSSNEKSYYNRLITYEMKKDEIIRATKPSEVKPQLKINNDNDDYAFISYSSKDFRPVYCDIVEMQKIGIQCYYDENLVSDTVGELNDRIKWYSTIENKIKDSACVICYLSPNFVASPAILTELKIIEKHHKPIIAIDLTGKNLVSKIIVDMINNEGHDAGKKISSETLYWFTKIFSDDISVITREQSPDIVIHIEKLKNVLSKKFPQVINNIESDAQTVKTNKTPGHPNEDYFVNDAMNQIYIVADGITRGQKEYARLGNSVSYCVSKRFADRMHAEIKEDLFFINSKTSIKKLLVGSFQKANADVYEYLKTLDYDTENIEKPGCVAIAALIYDQCLYFGNIGDCVGVLVRNNQKIVFAGKQTEFVFDKLNIERDRKRLIDEYVNKPDNKYGYGVINGEDNAKKYFNVSHIDLEYGDVIYLMSDGASDYVTYAKPQDYKDKNASELLNESENLDNMISNEFKQPSSNFYDDRTVIRIQVGESDDLPLL